MAGGGAPNPGSWNRYAYVEGDPVNYIDPFGLYRCDAATVQWSENGAYRVKSYVLKCADPVRYPDHAGTSGDIPESQRARESNSTPVPTDWELMGDAVNMALGWLQRSPDCQALFGTESSRNSGWDPRKMLADLYMGGGIKGPNGQTTIATTHFVDWSVGAQMPLGAITVPMPTAEWPGLGVGSTPVSSGFGAVVFINGAYRGPGGWNGGGGIGNAVENAVTLLHELGHVYTFLALRGSGGSQISLDPFGIGSGRNDRRVFENCIR